MKRFDKLTAYLDSLSGRYGIPACDCALAAEGETVYRHQAGHSDLARTVPAGPEDTYWLYSASKLFTCAALLTLTERGLLGLEDPVSKYLPEYAHITVRGEDGAVRPARSAMRVRHLFTMTCGLDYDLTRPALAAVLARPDTLTTRSLAEALSRDPLNFEPGTRYRYSLGHDVLAAVAEVITGERFSDFLTEAVLEPLDIREVTFHPTPDQLRRLSAQYTHVPGPEPRPMGQGNHYNICEGWESGGGGLLGTVGEYMKLPAALALGGVSPAGRRVLKAETVDLMRTPALGPVPLRDFRDRSPADRGHSYGLGVRVLVDTSRSRGSLGQFGWDGAAGAFVIADPARRAALVYAQHVCSSAVTYQEIHPTLRELMAEALEG